MPIDRPSRSIDVNPVKVKLSTDDISQAIEQLPLESRLQAATQMTHADANENSPKTDPRPTSNQDNNPPTSPMKGKLKVKNYSLKKSRQSNRTYRCQKCGCKKGSVHDLDEHHRCSHPPLMCSECNKLFNVPSTFQLHMYDHQKKKKIPCEMCGQAFSFQGQLDQHKIVHQTIKTHKCMAKDCGRWFMRKADLTVHAETHNKKEYKCDKCKSFSTRLHKYWKEHMKGHEAVLPYACSVCEKYFLYQQQVSRHKAKDHKDQWLWNWTSVWLCGVPTGCDLCFAVIIVSIANNF